MFITEIKLNEIEKAQVQELLDNIQIVITLLGSKMVDQKLMEPVYFSKEDVKSGKDAEKALAEIKKLLLDE